MKKKTVKNKIMKIVVLICIVIILIYILSGFAFKFKGNEEIQENSYTIVADMLNTTKSTQMELKENDILDIDVLKRKGTLYFSIKAEDGEEIYQGTGIASSTFSIRVPKDSKYTITIKGKRAKTYLKIQKHMTVGDE